MKANKQIVKADNRIQLASGLNERRTDVQIVFHALQGITCFEAKTEDIFTVVKTAIAKAYADTGFKITAGKDLNYMVNTLAVEIKTQFPAMRVQEIPIAFSRGVRYEYGDYKGLSVVEFIRFVKKYLQEPDRAEAMVLNAEAKREGPKPAPTQEEYFKSVIVRLQELFDCWRLGGKLYPNETSYYGQKLFKERVIVFDAEVRQELKAKALTHLIKANDPLAAENLLKPRKALKDARQLVNQFQQQGVEHKDVIRYSYHLGLILWFDQLDRQPTTPTKLITELKTQYQHGDNQTSQDDNQSDQSATS